MVYSSLIIHVSYFKLSDLRNQFKINLMDFKLKKKMFVVIINFKIMKSRCYANKMSCNLPWVWMGLKKGNLSL